MKKVDPKTVALVIRTVVGLFLLVAAVGIFLALKYSAPTIETDDQPRALRVPVFEAQQVELPRQWRGFGTVEADRAADVPARVGATVTELPEAIEVGRVVEAGALLVQLEDSDFVNDRDSAQQRIEEVKAGLEQLAVEERRLADRLALQEQDAELARADYQRQVDRQGQGGASPADVDRARRTLLQAERAVLDVRQSIDGIAPRRSGLLAQEKSAMSQRDLAQQNVDRARIVAPIGGVLEAVDVEEGENVTPGSRIARIVDPRVIEVPIQLPASARGDISVGDSVTVLSRSHPPDCTWSAEVTRVGAINDPTRTFTVFARIDQSAVPLSEFVRGGGQRVLVPGVFVTARLTTARGEPRWIVPARSVQEGRVRLVEGRHIVSRPVTITFDYEGTFEQFDVPDDQWVVLNEALVPGDMVVLSASLSILDGQEVVAVLPDGSEAILPQVGAAGGAGGAEDDTGGNANAEISASDGQQPGGDQ